MAIKPGPTLITISASSLMADSISQSYDTEFFDRVEFDHDKLKSTPLSTGTVPTIVTLLGGKPAEVVIDCALTGMVGGASSYVPRPLTPNSYPSDYNLIKNRFDITRFSIQGGQTPESATPGAIVDAVMGLRRTHRNMLAQFQTRLGAFAGNIAYETLIAAQADNIFALYFTTGTTFTCPLISASNVLITDFTETHEYIIPNQSGSYDIYKGFNMVLEVRTLTYGLAV